MKKILLFMLIIVLSLMIAPLGMSQDSPVARLIIFHSPTCPHCRLVLEEDLPPLQEKYGAQLEVRLYNLQEEDGYASFQALLQHFPDLPTGIPQAYIGEYVLVGSVEIPQGLPVIIEECLANGGCDWPFEFGPAAEPTAVVDHTSAAAPVYLAYCYDASCLECDRVNYDLQHLEAQYPNLQIERLDVANDAALIEALCERYDVPPEQRLAAPAIFIGDEYLSAEAISMERLTTLIDDMSVTGSPQPWANLDADTLDAATAQLGARFSSFSVLAIMAAGLLDGVNPCAFTTIIFLISYLAISGRRGKDILLVGAAFTLAVFLTYLALGLGLSTLLQQLGGISIIGRVIYGLTAVLCLVLAGLSLWDYVKVRRGQLNEIVLQLPRFLKDRIHATIRTRSRMQGFVGAAFVAGVLVSLFELACTGQVYLPTIVFMTGISELRMTAILYLVLYNLLFVMPLIAVFTVTYMGTGSKQLTTVFQSNVGAVKLLTAVLFGVLGVWLVYMVAVTF